MNLQDPLFICSVSGSANTTLHSLLTYDTKIVLGLDRYKDYTHVRINSSLLSKSRFFDFDTLEYDRGRNLPYYQNVGFKHFDTAAYIGDQSSDLFLSYDKFKSIFPRAKLIILLRNPLDVCASVIQSAQFNQPNLLNSSNPSTPIPTTLSPTAINEIVLNWNRLIEFVGAHMGDGEVKLVFFEELCADIKVYLSLYEFLGLELPKQYEANYARCIQRCLKLDEASKPLITEALKFNILRTANSSLYQLILQEQFNSVSGQGSIAQSFKTERQAAFSQSMHEDSSTPQVSSALTEPEAKPKLTTASKSHPIPLSSEAANNEPPQSSVASVSVVKPELLVQGPSKQESPSLPQSTAQSPSQPLIDQRISVSREPDHAKSSENNLTQSSSMPASAVQQVATPVIDPNVTSSYMPPLVMDEQDILSAQRIFLGQEILREDEVQALIGKDGLFVQSFLMKSQYFQSNQYNASLVVSIATELAKKMQRN